MDVLKQVHDIGIIPVIAVDKAEQALPLCEALVKGGLPAAEITFRTAAGQEAIKLVAEKNPRNYIRAAFESVNRSFGVRCDAKEAFSIFFWNADKGKANIIFAVDMEHASVEDACSYIKQYMEENYDVMTVFGHTPTLSFGDEYADKIIKTPTWCAIDMGAGFGREPVLLRLEDMAEFRLE